MWRNNNHPLPIALAHFRNAAGCCTQVAAQPLPGVPLNCDPATRASIRWGAATAAFQVSQASNHARL
jgi:hypothetical protein